MNKAQKYNVSHERTKLINVHGDKHLKIIQTLLTPKIFHLFYRNYIESLRAHWSCNV